MTSLQVVYTGLSVIKVNGLISMATVIFKISSLSYADVLGLFCCDDGQN